MDTKTRKVTITLPDGVIQSVQRSVKAGKARSVSARIAQIVEEHEDEALAYDMIDEWRANPPRLDKDGEQWVADAIAKSS